MTHQELSKAIFDVSHLTGKFTLRSGKVSNEYFDKYLFESRPALLSAIAEHLKALLPENVEVLAGLEMGGIPITTALSIATGLPAAFVRKQAKGYGTNKVSEGAEISGKPIVIVEDVITSGGQVVLSAKDLRDAGANILCCVCVIDREQGGREALSAIGIEMRALCTMTELKAAAVV
jgi:orotate phosphoribosyltransferase